MARRTKPNKNDRWALGLHWPRLAVPLARGVAEQERVVMHGPIDKYYEKNSHKHPMYQERLTLWNAFKASLTAA
mgnify:CR=1 FL=1